MILAAIGGIHGNLPALEAVLRHIDNAGIHTVLNVGNSVVGLPWPNEVVDVLAQRAVTTVQGEMDRAAVRVERKGKTWADRMDPAVLRSLEWTNEALTSTRLETINGWPARRMLTLDGISVCLCHGAPSGQHVALDKDTPEHRFRRERELANAQIILVGNTPRPFSRWIDGTLFVNPGSVGAPSGKTITAVYSTINTEEDPWAVNIHRVKYSAEPIRP